MSYSTDDRSQFETERDANIRQLGSDHTARQIGIDFVRQTAANKYTYNFTWLGLPIIQLPQDIVAMQEIIWRVKPDLVIEIGLARGGGLILYASLLTLIGASGKVLGVDLDIRPHNRSAIETHPLSSRITLITGSSVDQDTSLRVHEFANGATRVVLVLDSNHTHAHVLDELRLYSDLVKEGGYLVVCDTSVEDLPGELFHDRPWGPGDNPKTAVREFLHTNDRFVVDSEFSNKLVITASHDGYLRCVKD